MAIVFPFMSRRAAKDEWVAPRSKYLCRSPAPSSVAKPTPPLAIWAGPTSQIVTPAKQTRITLEELGMRLYILVPSVLTFWRRKKKLAMP